MGKIQLKVKMSIMHTLKDHKNSKYRSQNEANFENKRNATLMFNELEND